MKCPACGSENISTHEYEGNLNSFAFCADCQTKFPLTNDKNRNQKVEAARQEVTEEKSNRSEHTHVAERLFLLVCVVIFAICLAISLVNFTVAIPN